jgi:hypothetical protein
MQPEGRIRVSALDWISLLLVIVGALNWGLVGIGTLLDQPEAWNLVDLVFGSVPTLEAIVYLLVGLAGLYELYFAYQLYRARGAERPTAGRAT